FGAHFESVSCSTSARSFNRPLAFLLATKSSKLIRFTGRPSIVATILFAKAFAKSPPETLGRISIKLGTAPNRVIFSQSKTTRGLIPAIVPQRKNLPHSRDG